MRFGILGATQAWDATGEPLRLGGPGRRALLALLLLDAGRLVPVERLVDGLYGEDPPPTVGNALQAQVSRLRSSLGLPIENHGGAGYLLAVDRACVDAHRFAALAESGRAALSAGLPADAASALREALGLWRGPALADVRDAPFADAQAVRLEELRLGVFEDRVEAELALGPGADLVAELRTAVAAQPLRERLTEQLMRALYALGRQAEALSAYTDLRTALDEELGAEPGPAVAATHLSVLRADPSLGVVSRVPAAPLQTHAADHRVSRETPARVGELFGREADLRLLRRRLEEARLVTLTGPGGMGKTTLAVETAAHHPGGSAFADLSMVTDGGGLPQAVLGALGLRDSGVRGGAAPTLTRLSAALADRGAFLLVLDNCEQVVADAAALVGELLACCPELRVLATSREALLVPGEYLLPLEPLAEAAAVRLFAERARAVRPDFDLAVHAQDVAEICRRLDGLPLAVELAAARMRMLTPRQIADRLDDRFRLLTASRSRGAQPRQQTLRAVVEWSWDLLDEDERRMLTRVAVFTGGWTLEAAEAVCGTGPDTLDLIGALVDKSLVVAGAGRYRMLETIRAFAAEALAASGDEPQLRAQHRTYFLDLARAWEPELRTVRQLAVLDGFDDEHDNMLAALADAPAPEALELVACMSTYWMLRGLRGQGRGPALRILRDLGPDVPPGCDEQFVLCVLSAISAGIDGPELHAYVDRCRPLMDRLMFTHPLRFPTLLLLWAPFTGVPDEEDMIARNQAALNVVDDPWYLALMHFGVGFQYWYQEGDEAATGREFGQALTGFEQLGDRWGMMMALVELARLAGRTGDRRLASDRTDRALEIAAQLRSPDDMAEMLWSRAEFALHDDDLAAAEADLRRAEELARPLGISDNLARTRLLLAQLALRKGELTEAERLCAAARAALPVGWSSAEWTEAAICAVAARVALARGDAPQALDALRAAARAASGHRNLPALAPVLEVLQELALVEGRPTLAARVAACGPDAVEDLLADW